jgi:hypothetical protein
MIKALKKFLKEIDKMGEKIPLGWRWGTHRRKV